MEAFALFSPEKKVLGGVTDRMPFTIFHGAAKVEFPTPPDGATEQYIKETVAGAFQFPVGSFSIKRLGDGVPGYFSTALEGEWNLVLIPREALSYSSSLNPG